MMDRRLQLACVLLAAGTLLGACSGGDARARGATLEYDTVGDTIIARAQGPALWGDAVTLREELRIGTIEGADAYTLGNVVSMTVDDAGNVYVLDDQALTVRKYDAQGRHLGDIGRSGGGPGELKRPHSLDFLPDGRLAVRDFGNARINFYDAAGESVGSIPIPGGFATSTPMHVDSAGRIYTSVIADRIEGQMFRVGFQRFDETGSARDTIRNPRPDFQAASALIATSPDGRGMSATSVPFMPGVQWTLDRAGNVVWGTNDRYEINTIRDGRPYRIARVVDALPVSAAEKSTERQRIERNMKQTQPNWSWQGPGIPDTKPFFRSIAVAHDGRIWVQVSQPAVLQPADTTVQRAAGELPPIDRWIEPLAYDVFDANGEWLARVAPPEKFRPMYMRGDYVWGVQRDEFDVNYVVRLAIVRGA